MRIALAKAGITCSSSASSRNLDAFFSVIRIFPLLLSQQNRLKPREFSTKGSKAPAHRAGYISRSSTKGLPAA